MSTSTTVTVVLVDDPLRKETIAVGGFLAGYCGSTRRSYATDLRLFSAWCDEANLTLFEVRRGPPRAVRPVDGGVRADALHRRPAPVHPGQLLQVLRPGPAFLAQAGLGTLRDHACAELVAVQTERSGFVAPPRVSNG